MNGEIVNGVWGGELVPVITPSAEDIPEIEGALEIYKTFLSKSTREDNMQEVRLMFETLPSKNREHVLEGVLIAMMNDWCDALAEYDKATVKASCAYFRRNSEWLPTQKLVLDKCREISWADTHRKYRLEKMLKKAREKAVEDKVWRDKIRAMKEDGTYETIKARLYQNIKTRI
jgi:hypothetical protein